MAAGRTRVSAVVAGVVALVLVASGATAAMTDLDDMALSALGVGLAAEDCESVAPTMDAAFEMAVRCGHEVAAQDSYSPWETSYAQPNGLDVRWSSSASAVRSGRDDGSWASVDRTVEPSDADGDGRLEVAAPVFDVSFASGADDAEPLAKVVREGHWIEYDVPFDLPEPVVAGDVVTYPAVMGEGIDLIVQADPEATGFRELIRVADEEAASNPELEELAFDVHVSPGLTLVDEGDGFAAIDADGEQVFLAPVPLMWSEPEQPPAEPVSSAARVGAAEASESAAGDEPAAPGMAHREDLAELPVDVEPTTESGRSATVSIVPDQEMLVGEDAVFPVVIDPSVTGVTLNEWAGVKSAWPTSSSGYKFQDRPLGDHGVGLCDAGSPYGAECAGVTSKQRVLYEFRATKVGELRSMDITGAEFSVSGVFGATCQAAGTMLYQLGNAQVSTSTSWNSMASWSTQVGSKSVIHRSGCDGRQVRIGFDVTESAKKVASSNWSYLTLGLKVDESTMSKWKRYAGSQYNGDADHGATLSVTYNRPPGDPKYLKTWVEGIDKGCRPATSRAYLRTTRPTVGATITDPDGTQSKGQFEIWNTATENKVWGAYSGLKAGGQHKLMVSSGKLFNGNIYRWRVRAVDPAGATGAWSTWCYFEVDTSPPHTPTVDPVTVGVEAVYPDVEKGGLESGGAGQEGKFLLGAQGSTDTVRYDWSFGTDTFSEGESVAPGANHTISYTPKRPGAITLSVKAFDRAGNASLSVREYKFDVAPAIATAVWPLDDGTGTVALERVQGMGTQPLQFRGTETNSTLPQWTTGPHEEFESRAGDKAVSFDGVDDRLVTSDRVVDTSKSFVVSAHVWLDPNTALGGQHVALSQNGTRTSPFTLGYRASCTATNSDPCWAFIMYGSDADGATSVQAQAPLEAKPGEWVHLTGAYDDKTDEVKVWACQIGTRQTPLPGDPVVGVAATKLTTAWTTNAPFSVGRRLMSGVQDNFWQGRVDNVRVFDGQVVAESKIRRLCQGSDFETFTGTGDADEAMALLDPTQEEDM